MSKDDRELIEQEYRKTATIRAVQWFKMGDHPAVVLRKRWPEPRDECSVFWLGEFDGGFVVVPGDWIVTDALGRQWPIKPDIFAATYEPAATRLEALQAQPVGEESGWLVEMVEPDHNKSPVPRWWHPEHGWMWDANKALRFAREIDAQDYIIGSGRLPGKPTEHIFLSAPGAEA